MKSLVSPTFLKQKARQLRKEKKLTQSQALNEVAKELGFTSYKNYLNELEKNHTSPKKDRDALLRSIFSEKDILQKESLAISFIHDFNPPIGELLEIVGLFQVSQEAVDSVCSQSSLQLKIRKALLDYFKNSKKDVQALPLMQYFVAKEVSVRNLRYQIKDGNVHARGSYHLEFEFESEVPEEQQHLPHFRRDPMFGDFEAIIDKNTNISFENPSIGEEFDDQFYMGSFKLGHP